MSRDCRRTPYSRPLRSDSGYAPVVLSRMARFAAVGRRLRHLAFGACRPASPVLGVFRSSISPHAATYQHGHRFGCACLRSIKVAQRAASKQVRQGGRLQGNGKPSRLTVWPFGQSRSHRMQIRVESPPEVSEWARQSLLLIESQRKVRAPSDRAPGNAWGA